MALTNEHRAKPQDPELRQVAAFDKLFFNRIFIEKVIKVKEEGKLEKAIIKNEHKTQVKRKRQPKLPSAEDSFIRQIIDGLNILVKLSPSSADSSDLLEWIKSWQFGEFNNIDRAIIHLLYAFKDYSGVHRAISKSNIPIELESEMEDLWDNASYWIYLQSTEAAIKEGAYSKKRCPLGLEKDLDPSSLSAVNRYRIRKRLLCPTVQRYDGGKKYKISSKAKTYLQTVFDNGDQKPNRSLKEQIARETGLRIETVSNWFKNKRQRSKARALKSISYQPTMQLQEDTPHYIQQQQELESNNYLYQPQMIVTPQPHEQDSLSIINNSQQQADILQPYYGHLDRYSGYWPNEHEMFYEADLNFQMYQGQGYA